MPSTPAPDRSPGLAAALVTIVVLVAVVVAAVGANTLPGEAPPGFPALHLVFEGDSQSAVTPGVEDTAVATAAELEDVVLPQTLSHGGDTLVDVARRAAVVDRRLGARPGTAQVLVVWAGTNDLGAGDGPDVVAQRLADYAGARRAAGWKVVVLTALPRTFVLDEPGYEQRRLAFDDLVRAGWASYADALVDVAADARIGDDGDQDHQPLYRLDHIHLSTAGRRVVGALVADQLRTLGLR